jgi:acyl-CoA thioester hydrolase
MDKNKNWSPNLHIQIHILANLITYFRKMEAFSRDIQVRWSDLDPNVHLRHSVYYDWGALCRIEFFYEHGLTAQMMQKFHIGPILFREECVFKKEIHLGNKVVINLKATKARRDYSRWTIEHDIIKDGDIIAATLTVDGSWLNTKERKLAIVPPEVIAILEKAPRSENFQWLD